MIWPLPPSDYWQLLQAVTDGLDLALQNPRQSEPQLVANMVHHIPRAMNGMPQICGGRVSVKAGGVFVHQQPQVKCVGFPEPTPRSVELGDLLLIRSEKRRGTIQTRSALLLQAKKASLPATPDNKNQHHLYANWPTFEYTRSTLALNGKKRHITGPDLYAGCKYLLLGTHPHRSFHHPCCCFPHSHQPVSTAEPTWPELSRYACFVHELASFIISNAGRPFQLPPPKRTRNWDRVIEDLVGITGKRTSVYVKRASAGTTATRGQCFCFMSGCAWEGAVLLQPTETAEGMFTTDNGPPEVPAEDVDVGARDEGGISIVEFEVTTDGVK